MPKYNAAEVLRIAIDIEVDCQRFYRRSAMRVQDESARERLLALADMEVWHEEFFRELYEQAKAGADQSWQLDSDGEEERYLQAIADGEVFPKNKDAWKLKADTANLREILRKAISREKDAVIFFLAMEHAAVDEKSRASIHKIVLEEMSHVRMIAADLFRLRD